jgi:hypothetical protein
MTQQNYEQALQAERAARERAEYDSIVATIGATQSEYEAAQREYIDARMRGDLQVEADAQGRMMRAQSQLVTLENGKEDFDQRAQQQQQYQQYYAQQQYRQPTADEIIERMTALTPEEKQWLRERKHLVENQANVTRLQAAFYESQERGIQRGSKEYFDLFEDRFPGGGKDHRSAAGKTYGLNAQQLEAAKVSGISPETYAEQLVKLKKLKSEGHYSEG